VGKGVKLEVCRCRGRSEVGQGDGAKLDFVGEAMILPWRGALGRDSQASVRRIRLCRRATGAAGAAKGALPRCRGRQLCLLRHVLARRRPLAQCEKLRGIGGRAPNLFHPARKLWLLEGPPKDTWPTMIGCFTLWELFKKATRSLSRLLPSHLHVQQIVQLCSGKESSFELSPTARSLPRAQWRGGRAEGSWRKVAHNPGPGREWVPRNSSEPGARIVDNFPGLRAAGEGCFGLVWPGLVGKAPGHVS
jgi:hypothetical protein